MTKAKPLPSTKQANQAAAFLKAFTHPTRLKLLCLLHQQPGTVNTLAEALKLSQPMASQHLATLRRLKLVEGKRSAQTVTYHLTAPLAAPLITLLHNHFCKSRP